jgi:hypothetical protein
VFDAGGNLVARVTFGVSPTAASFEVDLTGVYLKAGTLLDFETKRSFNVTVAVDDPLLASTPDATATFTLTVTDVTELPATRPRSPSPKSRRGAAAARRTAPTGSSSPTPAPRRST